MKKLFRFTSSPQPVPPTAPAPRGQGLVEFMLILPILLVVTFGIIEMGRLLAIFSGASSAAGQAARYGSVSGYISSSITSTVFYLDCAGIRATAKRTAFLVGLADNNIAITYQRKDNLNVIGQCNTSNPPVPVFTSGGATMTYTNTKDAMNGGRIVITVTTTYKPLVPLVPIPELPMTFALARTIFTEISRPTSTPIPPPDLAITKTVSPASVIGVGGTFTYTIMVSNLSTVGTASSVVVTDIMTRATTSIKFTSLNVSVTAGLLTCPSSFSFGNSATTSGFSCSAPVMGPNKTYVITVVGIHSTSNGSQGGNISNTAAVSYNGADSGPNNNSSTVNNSIANGADLEIALSDAPDPMTPGGTVTYTAVITNNGSAAVSGYHVSLTVPSGATSVIPPVGVSCTPTGAVYYDCTPVGTLNMGQSTSLNFKAVHNNGLGALSLLQATAGVFGGNPADPLSANDVATQTTTVLQSADLWLENVSSPEIIGVSTANSTHIIKYTLVVTNAGPTAIDPNSDSVILTATLPAGGSLESFYSYAGNPGEEWACTLSLPLLECFWNFGATPDLFPTLAISVVVPASVPNPNPMVLSATVTSAFVDPNPANNTNIQDATTVLDCSNPQVVIPANTTLTVNTSPIAGLVQADGTEAVTVQVKVTDGCGIGLTDLSGHSVSLSSSRGGVDVIATTPGTTSNLGIATFTVKSSTTSPHNGTAFTPSTFTAIVTPTAASSSVSPFTVAQTGQAAFACAVGIPFPPSSLNFAYIFSNPSGINRRLIQVSLSPFPTQASNPGGPMKATSATFGAASPPTIWTAGGGGATAPFIVPRPAPQALNWDVVNDPNRNLDNNATQVLTLIFSKAILANGQAYTLETQWDNTANGQICNAVAVVTNRN